MHYILSDAHERVAAATQRSTTTRASDLVLDIKDAYRLVRATGWAPESRIDDAIKRVIHLERRGELKQDRQMLQLAKTSYYQAMIEDFRLHRFDDEGRPNLETMYRMHARLFHAGRFMGRKDSDKLACRGAE